MTDTSRPQSFTEYKSQQEDLAIRRMQAENERLRLTGPGTTTVSRDGVTVSGPTPVDDEKWKQLTRPFEADEVNLLPKGKGSGDEIHCEVCGGRHKARGIFHVPYVGHARVTNRLNEVDPSWVMTPSPFQFDGDMVYMPVTLTVLGITRHEVGVADRGDDDWPKQVYSDAITRAAMRFGVALDLWMKVTPGQEASASGRRSRGSRGRSGPPPAGTTDQRDPALKALLDALQEDVAHLDLTGAASWKDWKDAHVEWWKDIDAVTEARDYIVTLLEEPF